ncbi:MAG TPA: formate C-acetyltransferase/glycerol dehydratase family glycyl radical enzyme [Clostridiales bacterium]|nr:formate C-acetyltransferase/glycerol dehydratase family glycyl radical enzyme [Clostridiales bacterium]
MKYVNLNEKKYADTGAVVLGKKIYRSPRIEKLRNFLLDSAPTVCSERATAVTAVYRECESDNILIKRAKALKRVLETMSIFILDGELLVGNQASTPRSAPVFPEFSIDWIIDELDGNPMRPDERQGDRFLISGEHEKNIREAAKYWPGKTHADYCNSMLPEEIHTTGKINAVDSYWLMNGADGHLTVDLKRVAHEGLLSFKKQAQAKIDSLDLAVPRQMEQLPFLESCVMLCDAITAFAHRYARLAEEMAAKEKDGTRKAELLTIADICGRVPEHPARTFHEALQAYWFINLVIQIENNGHSYSLGRLDTNLLHFYEDDIKSGALTSSEDAVELLSCLFLKLFQLNKIFTFDNQKSFSGYQLFQNITIAGQDQNGHDATNELSYLVLETQAAIALHTPSISARYHDRISNKFIQACLDCIKRGGGQPALYSDEIYIPALVNRGMPVQDATEYSVVGCVEAVSEGKCGHRPNGSGLISLGKIVELAINNGVDPRTGLCNHRGKGDLSTFRSFGEVFDAVKEFSAFYIRQQVIWDNIIDKCTEIHIGDPLVSMLVEDCIGRGKPLKEGGMLYDYAGPEFIGTANVGNCLAAIKKILFEEKVLTGEQILHALRTNFADGTTTPTGAEIRQILLNAPKFGNDDDYVDSLTTEYFRFICEEIVKYKTTRDGRGPIGAMWQPSTSTISANVPFGETVGATPDGRLSGEPLADTTSPMHGTDVNGPTASLKSVSKLPTVLVSGGQLLNIKLNPSSLETPNGNEKFISLIRTFLGDLKGMHVQFNIVDAAVLKKAQAEPEKYKDLMVRVAGYSALFAPLDRNLQNDIIARTEHKL